MGAGSQGSGNLIGQVIGGYRLIEGAGSGAAGDVFRGRREDNIPTLMERPHALPLELPREAAIKILAPSWRPTDEQWKDLRKRFLREAETLQRLQHPHILSILDYGDDPDTGHTYMILPYMPGGTLASYQARLGGPAPLGEVASLLSQVAEALDYAHSQGVIHRDIKPSNILLDGQGQAYIADFGIVRIVNEAHTKLTSTGGMLGTPDYMAPEQFDNSSKVGPAADIYGLGMVVYELVTGRTAFSSTSWGQFIKAQMTTLPAPPRSLRPDLPEPAEAAIMRALEKDPAKRFDSAAAFAEAFSLGLEGQWASGLTRYIAPVAAAAGVAGAADALSDSRAQTMPNATAATPPLERPRRAIGGLVGAAAAALLILACVAGAFASGNISPLLAVFGPHATATTAVHVGTASPSGSVSPAAQPTATTHKSGGGGGVGAPVGGGGGGGGAAPPTATPKPAPTATFTPIPQPPTNTPIPPPPPKTITIGWSSGHTGWIWMTLNNFPPATYTYSCNFSTPPQSNSFTLVETTEPQTWDNGKTCYDFQHGDHLWVIVNGVWSNTITVP